MPRFTIAQVKQAFLTGEGLPAESRRGTWRAQLKPSGIYVLVKMLAENREVRIAIRFRNLVILHSSAALNIEGRSMRQLAPQGTRFKDSWDIDRMDSPSCLVAHFFTTESASLEEENQRPG